MGSIERAAAHFQTRPAHGCWVTPDADDLLGRQMHELSHHTKSDGSPYPLAECRIYQAFWKGEPISR